MSYYHIIIATERRTDPARMATAVNDQLHSFTAAGLPENFDTDPQFVGVFEWDGVSPYVIEHKGSYADRTMGFAGWPEITKEQYEEVSYSSNTDIV